MSSSTLSRYLRVASRIVGCRLAAKYHLGNWVVDRQTGEKRWEVSSSAFMAYCSVQGSSHLVRHYQGMPAYVRVGMQLLYHGKEQVNKLFLRKTRVLHLQLNLEPIV